MNEYMKMEVGDQMKVNRKLLIEFFDTNQKENKSHSSAINGVCGEDIAIGVLKHYFGKEYTVTDLGTPHENKKGGGKWLDGWLGLENKSGKLLYQIEVKSWSAHSLGGKELAFDADVEEVKIYKQQYWSNRWNDDDKKFREESVNKIFLEMKLPPGWEDAPLHRLVCFWAPLSRSQDELSNYRFTVEANDNKPVEIFSLSGYLREMKDDYLELELPRVAKRVSILNSIFVSHR